VLKTYGLSSLRGIDRVLHTAQAMKLHKLTHKLKVLRLQVTENDNDKGTKLSHSFLSILNT